MLTIDPDTKFHPTDNPHCYVTGTWVDVETCLDIGIICSPRVEGDTDRLRSACDFDCILTFNVWGIADDGDMDFELLSVAFDAPMFGGKSDRRTFDEKSDPIWFKLCEEAIERDRAHIMDRIQEEML